MTNYKTVASVIKDDLCTGCGTCAGICPLSAIEMIINESRGVYVPRLDDGKCNECGDCFAACPGHTVDFKQLNSEIFGKQPDDILLGNYLNCYVGHATDYEIRYNSTSGGLVTALLIFALEEGIIDGALVTGMNPDNPFEPLPFIGRTREEIISAAGSKYCPVPANTALKEILNSKEGEKFAVVGLPCHIHGIRKMAQFNKKLKESIVLHLGIFCGHAPTFLWTKFHLWRKGISKEKIARIDYRGKGWPGGMAISFRDGNKRFIHFKDTWGWYSTFCYYRRCTLCCDQAAELADISFADAWLPEFTEDKVGKSIVICRNQGGELILQSMASAGKLHFDRIGGEKAIQSQGGFYSKKRVIAATFALSRWRHRNIPLYKLNFPAPNILAYLMSLQLQFESGASSKRSLWGMLEIYISAKMNLAAVVKSVMLFGRRIQNMFNQ